MRQLEHLRLQEKRLCTDAPYNRPLNVEQLTWIYGLVKRYNEWGTSGERRSRWSQNQG
ncbi:MULTISPECIES: hypothetical protein [unclassified Microcoleus]|uniref:hypothetical protein n=1 Tax=unclassified Microcoleus TaxID=2642155 RepID=UPI002FD1ED0F